ncbi:unnamed protein product [Rhizoctonia solani]|uniref:Uncharacterized protein n=1 Tax=Rhizoctonia solani TaxID=456999 RepID=A0A8H3ASB7_9AGAM|nr:unnamed protein product [Rhizoctonia solani]
MFYYHLERQVISSHVGSPLDFRAFELIDSAPNDPQYPGALMQDPGREPINFQPNEETQIYHSNAHFGLFTKNRGGPPEVGTIKQDGVAQSNMVILVPECLTTTIRFGVVPDSCSEPTSGLETLVVAYDRE